MFGVARSDFDEQRILNNLQVRLRLYVSARMQACECLHVCL